MRYRINICYKKNYNDSLKEKVEIAEQKVMFIKKVKEYKEKGLKIFPQDETWINQNIIHEKPWMEENLTDTSS